MDFVLIHGSGGGAWAWDGVRPLLEQAGHRVHCPSLSGMGDAGLELPVSAKVASARKVGAAH